MNEVTISLLCVIVVIISLCALGCILGGFLSEFKKSCHKSIEKRNKEIDDKEKLNRELRKWLFK